MKLSSFGALQISVIPHADNVEEMSVDIGAENRLEPVHMDTKKDETVDQFVMRIKSMLRSLMNAEPREKVLSQTQAAVAAKEVVKRRTWEETKEGVMSGGAVKGGTKV